jgi:chemotaxis protein methyltransferase CheR
MLIQPADIQLIRDLVLKRAGIVLDQGKEYLIEARLAALVKKEKLASVEHLLAQLRTRLVSVERAVVDAMTTNETSFFRDLYPFDAMKQFVVPELIEKRKANRTLSIWCAASSTGQEPYTLAMVLREHFPQLANWKVTFIASDLSREVLARARAGRYTQMEVNRGLPAPLLIKYFKKDGLEWEIAPELRQMIDFREINLLEPWPGLPMLDIVFIRNVLIYFSTETKKEILRKIRTYLRSDGFLFLGGAETTLNIDDNFDRVQLNKSGCYRLSGAMAAAA